MKATELIIELQKLVDKHGDLDVRAFADHGQVDIEVTSADVVYADSDEWVIESCYDPLEEYISEQDDEPNYTFFSLYAG